MSTPAAEIRSFQVTIPANTALDSPLTTAVSFPQRNVIAVHWLVPPGPSGLMGWRLTMSGGVPVIPTGGGWIIADDQSAQWPLTGYPDNGGWEITGYNTDIYDHSVYVDFLLDLIAPAPAAVVTAPVAALTSPASVLSSGVPVG